MITGVLLLGGEGQRFGRTTPKQFLPLSGKQIYLYTLEVFQKSPHIDQIILVCHPRFVEVLQKETTATVISGGKTRQESSYLGLLACGQDTEYVIIHDGVRPFITQKIITDNITAVKQFDAVDTCIPSADTIVHAKSNTQITSIPTRSEYLRGQTPQSFKYDLIMRSHEKARKLGMKNISDDCQLVLNLKKKVHIVPGSDRNIKITTEFDLFIAEQLLRQSETIYIGDSTELLKNKVYAISGGSGGIGQALAKKLQNEGATVLILSKTAPLYTVDLTNHEETKQTFKKISQTYGGIDGLINCVGLLKIQDFAKLTSDDIDQIINVNLKSVLYCCKHVKVKAKGHLINMASSSYNRGRKSYALYSAAKAAVVNFTQGLAEEMPEHFVNSIVPARTHTKMRTNNFALEDPLTLLKPEEVADQIIAFLKTGTSTGTILEIKKHQCQKY